MKTLWSWLKQLSDEAFMGRDFKVELIMPPSISANSQLDARQTKDQVQKFGSQAFQKQAHYLLMILGK
ncbi:MAG: hypothetical protein H5T33_02710 [Candidatus Methanosuratus sp.]|nr:hypothetical protein [Candidatus Methanosuratincola sp.]